MATLRPYQQQAVSMLRDALPHRPVLTLATGAGKTAIAAEICRLAHERGKRTLFLCDRREILLKTQADFLDLGLPTGIVLSGRVQRDLPHLVAAAQTLSHRTLPPADILIVDEAHRSLSPTQERIVQAYPTRIGLTATPLRNDGKGLGRLYGTLVQPISMRDLIDQGYLARYTYFAPSSPDLKRLPKRGGDYVPERAAERMMARHVVSGAVKAFQGSGARTAILFACTRAHSRAMAEAFTAAGIPAAHCDGDTPKAERAQALRDLASGALRVLSNVDLWSYGVDVPNLDSTILLRPTASLTVCRQQVGRALRPKPRPAVILDLAANVFAHGLPDDPVEWSLADGLTTVRSPGVRTCERCYAVYAPTLKACPACGYVNTSAATRIVGHEATLREVKVAPPKPPVAKEFRDLLATAHALGYKPGWAQFQFKNKHHYFPRGNVSGAIADERAGCLLSECAFCGKKAAGVGT